MSFRNFSRLILASAMAFTLAACSSSESASGTESETESAQSTETETIHVLVPSGAPALAMIGAFEEDGIEVEVVDGTDVISAELAKKDSEYDVIVAPVNLGANVYEQTETYLLDGILTWGNLYIVGTEEDQWNDADAVIAAFGQSAVPGLVFSEVLPEAAQRADYYSSVAEAQQALLSGKADCALLAQPAAAAAIAKGSENDLELSVICDLQTLWQQQENSEEKGYPQAAVFVKSEDKSKADTVMEKVESFLDSIDEEILTEKVNSIGAETLGVPSAAMAWKTWDAQNIHFKDAADAKSDVEVFLAVFGITPSEEFYLS